MERLFSPCTRYRDILESQGQLEVFIEEFIEESTCVDHGVLLRELNLDVSTEELLSAERAFTYADLYAMIENGATVAWLTPHAAVVPVDSETVVFYWQQLTDSCSISFSVAVKI
jgi:hypothetical protein